MVTGAIINEAMKAAKWLKEDGIDVQVVSIHTLKPIDTEAVAKLLEKTEKLVTIEEHNIIGGLYSTIAEVMVDKKIVIPLLKIGLNDTFAEGYGKIENVRSMNGVGIQEIYSRIKGFWKNV